MKRLSALGALVLTLVLAGSPAFARDFINDGASMFGASTVSDLNARISNFNAQTGKEVVVVTVPSLGGQTVRDAAEKEFAQRQVNGVLIYIAKDDRKDIFVPDSAGVRAGWFSPGTLDPIRQNMESQFKDGNFDAGITAGVGGVLGIYRSHLGSLNRGGSGNTVPVTQTRPYSNAASTGGFHISMFWLIVILVAAFLVLRSLIRAMSAPRPPMMQGGAPGAPGYGPGYGYGPGGYGGGGGSFFSGLLGGLGGAFLGNELFGNRGGGSLGGGESQGSFGDASGGGAPDAGGWGSDAGQADMGGSSGGDWSGGGFGGGDSGGGFGGGDFGGGGGGDSGGGW